MRKILPFIFLISLTACGATPKKQYGIARETFTDTVEVLNLLVQKGIIKKDQALEIDKTVQIANAALDKAKEVLATEGNQAKFEDYMSIFQAALVKLQDIENQGKQQLKLGVSNDKF